MQEIGSSISVQALNAANVPLAVDKCISFVALHGITTISSVKISNNLLDCLLLENYYYVMHFITL